MQDAEAGEIESLESLPGNSSGTPSAGGLPTLKSPADFEKAIEQLTVSDPDSLGGPSNPVVPSIPYAPPTAVAGPGSSAGNGGELPPLPDTLIGGGPGELSAPPLGPLAGVPGNTPGNVPVSVPGNGPGNSPGNGSGGAAGSPPGLGSLPAQAGPKTTPSGPESGQEDATVPEPATLALFALGLSAGALRRYRNRRN